MNIYATYPSKINTLTPSISILNDSSWSVHTGTMQSTWADGIYKYDYNFNQWQLYVWQVDFNDFDNTLHYWDNSIKAAVQNITYPIYWDRTDYWKIGEIIKKAKEEIIDKSNETDSHNKIAKEEIIDKIKKVKEDIDSTKKELKEDNVTTRQLLRQKLKNLHENLSKLVDRQEEIIETIEHEADEIEEELEKIYNEEVDTIEKEMLDQFNKEVDEIELQSNQTQDGK